MYVFGGYEEIIERLSDENKCIKNQRSYWPIQVWARCLPIGPDQPHLETPGSLQPHPIVLFSNSFVNIAILQACIGEPPVHRDFHSATAIGLKYSYSLDPHKFLDLWSQGSLMFIFGGRSDLTGGQWHVNMGPDYYSNKVKWKPVIKRGNFKQWSIGWFF